MSQQRKFSTDVIICPTKAFPLLKKPCTFSFSCFYKLKSMHYGTLFFHFTQWYGLIQATSNTMEFTQHQNQRSSSPQKHVFNLFVLQISFYAVLCALGSIREHDHDMVHCAWVSWTQVWLDWKCCTYCKNHTAKKSRMINSWAAEYKEIWCRCVWCENDIFC